MATRALDRQSEKRLPHHAHHLPQFIRARLLLEHDVCRQHGVVHSRDEKSPAAAPSAPGRSTSPTNCIRANSSYGMSALKASITQSRYGQAFRLGSLYSKPLLSPYRATSSQCRAQRSPYSGEASSSSINLRYASSVGFCSNDRITSGSGGRPMRLKCKRRHQRSRSRRSVLRQAGLGQALPDESIDWVPLSSRY